MPSSPKSSPSDPVQKSLETADKLERKLQKIIAAEQRQLKNENIVRLEKNGDLSYETVRSFRGPDPAQSFHPNLLPDTLPQTPAPRDFGNLNSVTTSSAQANQGSSTESQTPTPVTLTPSDALIATSQRLSPNVALTCHQPSNPGNQLADLAAPVAPDQPSAGDAPSDPLQDLLTRAIAATKTRRGRPPALDDQAKGQLIALLSVGMSMRQAAGVIGVSHTTVQNALKAEPSLAEDITAARFQAQLQPLACVIREARRSWKAATWLLRYLDGKIATHEETPDERRARQQREQDEFLARASGRNIKTRHEVR